MKRLIDSLLLFAFLISLTHAKEYNHESWVQKFREKEIGQQVALLELQQSRERIREALGKIIPSLNLGTIIDVATTGPLGLLGSLDNLLGFLMPSNWFRWDESKMYYLAQYYNYMALRGNLIQMSEELYLSLKKTIRIQNFLAQTEIELDQLAKSISFRERLGELPVGSSVRANARLFEIRSDIRQIQTLINLYFLELNRLINAAEGDEITSIVVDEQRRLTPLNWELQAIMDLSVEIKSLEALEIASKYSKRARTWSFISFSGDGFGLGYFARNRMSTLEIEKVRLKLAQERKNMATSFTAINLHAANFEDQMQISEEAITQIDKRRSRILIDYRLTGQIDIDDYLEILDSFLKFNTLSIANGIAKEFYQAKKERLLLEGFYQALDDRIPAREIDNLQRYQRREDRNFD